MNPVGLIKDALVRMLQPLVSAAERAGDGMRRVRFRRAELLRMSATETAPDGMRAAEAFKWLATSIRGRPCPAVMCAPGSRVSYRVTLPAHAVVAGWCQLAGEAGPGNSGGVEFELRLRTQHSESSETCRLPYTSRRSRQWQPLRIDPPESGGAAQVELITRPIEGAGPHEPSAQWGGVRIEWPRTLDQLMRDVRSAIADRRIRGLRRRASLAGADQVYRLWAREHEPSRRVLRAQRQRSQGSPGSSGSLGSLRTFTLITFVEEPAVWRPGATAESVLAQSYPGWDWVLITHQEAMPELERVTAKVRRDRRVRLLVVPPGTTHADGWNAGLREASGEFIALLDPNDVLAPQALYEMAAALNQSPDCDVLYSDEDRLAGQRLQRSHPRFKPDWSPELLLSFNYIGRLALMRRSLATAVGGFRQSGVSERAVDGGKRADEGHTEWDLLLRLSRATDRIRRVAQCLYHRDDRSVVERRSAGSADPQNVTPITDHWQARGVPVSVSSVNGVCRSVWPIAGTPLVSVVIPNRNAAAVLESCLTGLIEQTAYRRHEIIIVDNGTTESETLDLYHALERGGYGRIVPFDRPFNFSAACNAGAAQARGDLVLFLNNDIEVIEPDWLDELIRWAQRPEVGVVGAKLLYPDRTIQHAGVAFGPGGLVDHIFSKAPEGVSGVFGSSECYRNYLAVTGACQMMRMDVFRRLGGFDERFRISFSDVLLCMEAWKAGYRVVYTPYARLVHHESYSRKREDSTQDIELLARYLRDNGFLEDPYFHPQLDPKSLVPTLRPPFERMPGQVVQDYIDRVLSVDTLSISAHGG